MGLLSISVSLVVLTFHFLQVQATTDNPNPKGDGCVDPKGFLGCYSDQADISTSCVGLCNQNNQTMSPDTYNRCIRGCLGGLLAGNIGCWIQACWNRVYTCEYQYTAVQYFDGLGTIQSPNYVPFYPPPDDASAGACSCNLGYVYGNQTYINLNGSPCTDFVSGGMKLLGDCQCCEYGIRVSNILNACPNSNLDALNINYTFAEYTKILQAATQDNCAILDDTSSDQCLQHFNIPHAGPTYINPLTAQPGRGELSNDDRDSFTEFGAPAYTLSLFPGFTSTITPAPYKAKEVKPTTTAAGGSGGAGASLIGSAAAGATDTGTAAGGTPTSAGSIVRNSGSVLLIAIVFVEGWSMLAI